MFNPEEKIMPIEEILHEDEFTGRVEILRELEDWIEQIGRVGAGSTSIIAPRRMGKTVLLDRLVNTVFYKPEYKVAPFYIKMKREETTLRKFLLLYATEFFRQYIAYCQQDPILYRRTDMKIEELLEINSENKAVKLAQQYIGYFIKRYNTSSHEDARNHWDEFIKVPEQLASFSGTRVAILIDEFQDMKFYIYDTDDDGLEIWKDKVQGKLSYAAVDLTATFDRTSLSKKAPMLVCGSAVTLIFRTVMGGPLGGRFGFKYLRALSIDDGATLISNLVRLYTKGNTISEENAIYASTAVNGHPYYLYCIATSDISDKRFDTFETIDKIVDYEIDQGKIAGFWYTHFEDNKQAINNDNDKTIGKKILYFITKYNGKKIYPKEIAEKIGASVEAVEIKLDKLYYADIIRKGPEGYNGFYDICLMKYIQLHYKEGLESLEKIDLSQRGTFALLKGHYLELVVQGILTKFHGEELEGVLLGTDGKVKVPTFDYANSKHVIGNSKEYQIDVVAANEVTKEIWVTECKYTESKIGIEIIKKAAEMRKAYIEERKREGLAVQFKVKLWIVSTGGFTFEALEYMKKIQDIYYCDYLGINTINKKYGASINIPIFKKIIP